MKRSLIFSLIGLLLVVLGTILYLNFESNEANNSTELISQNVSSSSRTNSLSKEQGSRIDGMTYTTTYDGKEYKQGSTCLCA